MKKAFSILFISFSFLFNSNIQAENTEQPLLIEIVSTIDSRAEITFRCGDKNKDRLMHLFLDPYEEISFYILVPEGAIKEKVEPNTLDLVNYFTPYITVTAFGGACSGEPFEIALDDQKVTFELTSQRVTPRNDDFDDFTAPRLIVKKAIDVWFNWLLEGHQKTFKNGIYDSTK